MSDKEKINAAEAQAKSLIRKWGLETCPSLGLEVLAYKVAESREMDWAKPVQGFLSAVQGRVRKLEAHALAASVEADREAACAPVREALRAMAQRLGVDPRSTLYGLRKAAAAAWTARNPTWTVDWTFHFVTARDRDDWTGKRIGGDRQEDTRPLTRAEVEMYMIDGRLDRRLPDEAREWLSWCERINAAIESNQWIVGEAKGEAIAVAIETFLAETRITPPWETAS